MGWIVTAIVLLIFFGRNLNLGASLTTVIHDAHQSPLSSPPGTTPGIPGDSATLGTFAASTPQTPNPPGPFNNTLPLPGAPSSISQSPAPVAGPSPNCKPDFGPSLNVLIYGSKIPPCTTPVVQTPVISKAVPVTGIIGRQTGVPENGGTFFTYRRTVV